MALSNYSLKKLKEEKTEGFLTYGSGAELLGSGASGAGAYRNAMAVASGWHSVGFLQAVGVGSSSLPDPLTASASYGVASGYVIGGTASPIGDVRGDGVGYLQSSSFAVGGTDPFVIPRGTEIVTALYAEYVGSAGTYWGKVAIGTTAGDVTTYGHYELTGTTPELHEFEAVYPIDTGSLASVTVGSGVYLEGVDVSFEVIDPMGEQLLTSADIKASALVSGVKTSILNADGTLKFPNYRENEASYFTFSKRDNIDVFGVFTSNFGIRNDVVSYNGDIHRSDYYVYTNKLRIDDVLIQDASGVTKNQTKENWTPPPTGSIGSREEAIKAISGFNQQPVYDSEGTPLSGATGYVEVQFAFENDPTYTTYGDFLLFAGDEPEFATNEGSLVGRYPLDQTQRGQSIRIYEEDGLPSNTGLYFQMAFDNPAGFVPFFFGAGPVELAPVPPVNMGFIPNKGNAKLEGDIVVQAATNGEGGYVTADCLEIGPSTYDYPYAIKTHEGHVGIGTSTSLQAGAKLSVNGRAIGTGDGGRLTGPSDLVYMLSGDAGTEADTLQTVTTRGNITTTDVGIGLSTTPNAQLHVSASAGAPTFRLSRAATAQIWEQTIDSSNRWHLLEAASEGGTQYTRLQIDDAGETLVAPNGGNVGIGISTSPTNKLDVLGAVGIGSSYAGTHTAPSNGLIVQGNVGIGTTAASCALVVHGDACGSGAGNRLTGPNGVPYLLVGDSPAETQTLQDVTENGNTTDQGIEVTAGGIKLNDYITHHGDADTYFGFNADNEWKTVVGGVNAISINSDAVTTFVGCSSVVNMGTCEGYGIDTEEKVRLGTIDSYGYSTGIALLGGSGNIISGDYDVIAGGALGNISGGDFNFIGGGSGIDITGSNYSTSIGGYDNDIKSSDYSIIAGGHSNEISGVNGIFVGGGFNNQNRGASAAIVGGQSNTIHTDGSHSFIGAGSSHVIRGQYNVIGGGANQTISGQRAVIVGGNANEIEADDSFAAGSYSRVQAGHGGAFVFSDSNSTPTLSTGANAMVLNFAGGVHVPTSGVFGEGLFVSGVPVLTGENNPAEADTLQTVTARGNTTTTSINSTGPHISGGTGIFMEKLAVGTAYSSYDATIKGTLQVKDVGGTYDGLLFTSNVGGEGRILAINTDLGTNHPLWLGGEYLKFTVKTGTEVEAMRIVQASDGKGSVGIGTVSPDARLDIVGDGADFFLQSDDYKIARIQPRGTSADLDKGLFSLFDGSTEAVRIDSASSSWFNGGSVGIGTVSPSNKLHVVGTTRPMLIESDNSANIVKLGNSAVGVATYNGMDLLVNSSVASSINAYGMPLTFGTSTGNGVDVTERVRIGTGGSVGIGTETPYAYDTTATRLHVKNAGSAGSVSEVARFEGASDADGAGAIVRIGTSNDRGVYLEGGRTGSVPYASIGTTEYDGAKTEAIHIDSAGRIGMGTNAPSGLYVSANRLVVGDGAGSEGMTIYSDTSSNGSIYFADGTAGSETYRGWVEYRHGNDRLDLGAGGGRRMVIDGNGVGIGTYTVTARLEVTGAASSRIAVFKNGSKQVEINDDADLFVDGDVGIGTTAPSESLEVSGSLLLGPRSSSAGNTMPFLKIDGYDEHGIEMGWGTWTKWKITTKVNGQLEIYNTGIQHQKQQVSIGRQDYHEQGNIFVYSTGSVLRAGHNGAVSFPILDIGVQDAPAGGGAYRGDAYIDVRASTSTPSRFHFKRDGEFIASGVSVSGDVLGTGVGNRITNDGTPYLLSGDSPAETQTLQDVCDNGNTTTTTIEVTKEAGTAFSATSGTDRYFVVDASGRIGLNAGFSPTHSIEIDNWGNKRAANIWLNSSTLHDASIEFSHNGAYGFIMGSDETDRKFKISSGNALGTNDRFVIDSAGKVGIGTTNPLGTTHIYTADAGGTIATNASHDDLIIENNGNCGIQLSSPASSYQYLAFGDTASANQGYVRYYHSSDRMDLRAGGSDILSLVGSKVGIGTTNPQEELDLRGDMRLDSAGATDRSIYFRNQSTVAKVRSDAALQFDVGVSSSPSVAMYIEEDTRNVGIGTTSPANALDVNGHISATSKSFLIDHPIEENKKLQYACLEGPENGVYVRGTTNSASIELPDYWSELIHEDSITVVVTPIGKKQDLYIKSKSPQLIMIGGVKGSYDYVVYGERKDIDRLEIEPLKV